MSVVMQREKHRRLMGELSHRFATLNDALEIRDLERPSEGTTKGSWVKPETMCATKRGSLDLRLAVADFKSILDEIKALK